METGAHLPTEWTTCVCTLPSGVLCFAVSITCSLALCVVLFCARPAHQSQPVRSSGHRLASHNGVQLWHTDPIFTLPAGSTSCRPPSAPPCVLPDIHRLRLTDAAPTPCRDHVLPATFHTRVCPELAKGTCPRGYSCHFAHSQEDKLPQLITKGTLCAVFKVRAGLGCECYLF